MFAPEVEARFKKIEDNLTAAAEILRRFEDEGEGRRGRVEAARATLAQAQDAQLQVQQTQKRVQNAMAWWLEEINDKMNAIADAHIRLSETVDRFLKARINGSGN